MTKHTPGPWKHKTAGPNHWIKAEGNRTVAFIGGKDSIFTATPGTPHIANARLIAAAPDLLEEAEAIIEAFEQDYWTEAVAIRIQDLRMAVTKATSPETTL